MHSRGRHAESPAKPCIWPCISRFPACVCGGKVYTLQLLGEGALLGHRGPTTWTCDSRPSGLVRGAKDSLNLEQRPLLSHPAVLYSITRTCGGVFLRASGVGSLALRLTSSTNPQ